MTTLRPVPECRVRGIVRQPEAQSRRAVGAGDERLLVGLGSGHYFADLVVTAVLIPVRGDR